MELQQSETADTIIGYSLFLNCPENKIGGDFPLNYYTSIVGF